MNSVHFDIWAVIILFGAAQGLFHSVSLLVRSGNRAANKWLALLLLAISLHLAEYAADITGLAFRYPDLIATTYPLLFCVGPLYYIYCGSLLNRSFKSRLALLLHFIPALLVLGLMMPFYMMPAQSKTDLMSGLEQNGVVKIPKEQLVFMAAHVVQTVAYVFAARNLIGRREKAFKDLSSDAFAAKKLGWLNAFSLYFSVYLLLYLVVVVLLSFIHLYHFELDYVLLITASFSMYAVGYSAISNPEIFKAFPEPAEVAPVRNPGNPDRFPGLKENLLRHMDAHKPYLKCDLRIQELAEALSVPYYQLSQLINDEFLVNFYDFVNKYRVEEAKTRLAEDTNNYKILAIAYETGFNSKATFNRVFRKFTGLTPSEFREQCSPQSGGAAAPEV